VVGEHAHDGGLLIEADVARLTLARKIAAITLLVWKKGVRFDAEHPKQQAVGNSRLWDGRAGMGIQALCSLLRTIRTVSTMWRMFLDT
jgi:hypothetical protein